MADYKDEINKMADEYEPMCPIEKKFVAITFAAGIIALGAFIVAVRL